MILLMQGSFIFFLLNSLTYAASEADIVKTHQEIEENQSLLKALTEDVVKGCETTAIEFLQLLNNGSPECQSPMTESQLEFQSQKNSNYHPVIKAALTHTEVFCWPGILRLMSRQEFPVEESLLDAFKESDPALRRRALWLLGELHSQDLKTGTVLMQALNDSDLLVFQQALEIVRKMKPQDLKVYQVLVNNLSHPNRLRCQSVKELIQDLRCDCPLIEDSLVQALEDPDSDLCQHVEELLQVSDSLVRQAYLAMYHLRSQNPEVRIEAAKFFSQHQFQDVVIQNKVTQALVNALQDLEAKVRKTAVIALGKSQAQDQVICNALADRLSQDGDPCVRSEAVIALSNLKSSNRVGIIKILEQACRDDHFEVRDRASWAVREMRRHEGAFACAVTFNVR